MAASKLYGALFVILISTVFAFASCPFAKGGKKTSDPPRGHNRPFGHHAKHWKRIQTVYEHPDPQTFYNEYVRLSKPLVIKGGVADWPAIKKWTNVSYINEIGGKERSHVNWKRIYNYDRHHAIRIDMTMKEFTDKFNTHDLYMDATIQRGLHGDVYWPHSLGCKFFLKRVKQLAIMMNNGKSKSDVHIDVTDTYFMQATGKRLWLLSPPSNVTSIYSGHPHLVDHAGISILNQTHMDLEKHTDASKLEIYAAFLHPGDIVYVPEAWYHQVVTYGSPNIAIVAFMNILFCEYHSNGRNDLTHVSSCVNNVLQRKPMKLECDAFPKEKITITKLLKTYKPRTFGAFQGYFGTPSAKNRYLNFKHVMSDGSVLPTIGMTLTGMSQQALKRGTVLKRGIVEGYRLFCTAPSDGSEEALGNLLKGRKSFRKGIKILSYLSLDQLQHNSVAESIDASLQRLNTSNIDFLLLAAPYCTPDYLLGACTRNGFNQSWADAWRALEGIQRSGKIRFLGVSDFSLAEIQQLAAVASLPITVVRARFDIYFRNKDLRRYCRRHNIHFMGRSVLGGRWKEERPDFPLNRDIFKEYKIQKAAYQYKLSIHSVVYAWAIMKRAIVCPRVNDPLHVRVNIKAIDSEATETVKNIEEIDAIDPTDKDGLYAPEAQDNPFSKQTRGDSTSTKESGNAETDEDEEEKEEEEEEDNQPKAKPPQLTESESRKLAEGNFSDSTYTDEKDFERFPSYMMGREES